MQKLHVIKIGGNIIDDANQLASFLQSFAKLSGPKILVHGGGKIASTISLGLGIATEMVDGRRITNAETLKVVTMVYGGLINKNIVAQLQAYSCNAIGLSGADANIIPAQKRIVQDIDYGFVGDLDTDKIRADMLKLFLDTGLTPILAPLTHDQKGNMLNTNADTIAAMVAARLSHDYDVTLMYCFEQAGVLKDLADPKSVLEHITTHEYAGYKNSGIITKGMIPKLDNAFEVLAKGVKTVYIAHAKAVDDLVLNKKPYGTQLYA